MAKAAKGRKTTATRTPRKKRGAKLLIDQPKQTSTDYPLNDQLLRERCLQFATGLNGGKEMKLADLIDQAKEIYNFIMYSAPAYDGFSSISTNGLAQTPTQHEQAPESGPETTLTTTPHRSKFEETHAL